MLAPPTHVYTDMDAILAIEEASRQMNLTLKEKQKEAVLTILMYFVYYSEVSSCIGHTLCPYMCLFTI